MTTPKQQTLPTSAERFLEMVERAQRTNRKTSMPEAYDVAVEEWQKTYGFKPPYATFDSFRKFRERTSKR